MCILFHHHMCEREPTAVQSRTGRLRGRNRMEVREPGSTSPGSLPETPHRPGRSQNRAQTYDAAVGGQTGLWGMTTQPSASLLPRTPPAQAEVAMACFKVSRNFSVTPANTRSRPQVFCFCNPGDEIKKRLQAKRKARFPFSQGLILARYYNIMKIFIGAWIMPWNRYCAS